MFVTLMQAPRGVCTNFCGGKLKPATKAITDSHMHKVRRLEKLQCLRHKDTKFRNKNLLRVWCMDSNTWFLYYVIFYGFITTNVLKAHVITEDCFFKDTF